MNQANRDDEPCTAEMAVERALHEVGAKRGQYLYGSGDYRPWPDGHDVPWSADSASSDCAGFAICWAWMIRRHRPGFNIGPWATVSDDVNVNSCIEDAEHHQDLFRFPRPGDGPVRPGDLLCYPTFRAWGTVHVGHVGLVVEVRPGYVGQRWDQLSVAHCHGPNGFRPGAVVTDGSIWLNHDWRFPQHPTRVVRPRERS